MLVGFQLCDREQVAQMIEPMPQGEPGQLRERLGDKARGFIRAPIARKLGRDHSPPLR